MEVICIEPSFLVNTPCWDDKKEVKCLELSRLDKLSLKNGES
jgi:hypothetical protein